MVRQLTPPQALRRAWKPFLAMFVVLGGLLWHMLACVESPMAFSPDGKQLAFALLDVAGEKDIVARLMVITPETKELRIVEETSKYMISAPAFSPDGRQLAYFRVPFVAAHNDFERIHWYQARQQLGAEPATQPAKDAAPPAAITLPEEIADRVTINPQPGEPEARNCMISDAASAGFPARIGESAGPAINVRALLVIRDAKTLAVTSTVSVPMQYHSSALLVYSTLRPQFDPDGEVLYFCDYVHTYGLDLTEYSLDALAAGEGFSLSPDAKTLAVFSRNNIGFVATDGSLATYRRIGGPKGSKDLFHFASPVWLDKTTCVTFADPKSAEPSVLQFYTTDGKLARKLDFQWPERREAKDGGNESIDLRHMAVAPDGKHMVLSDGNAVLFLDAQGKTLGQWSAKDNDVMLQPAFTPDGSMVAMKVGTKPKGDQTEMPTTNAIAFFTPEGQEKFRVAIPASKLRPATAPTTQK